MSIQEVVFVLGSIIFIWALIPSVFSKNKPHADTSLITGLTLGAFGLTYLSMDFYFASITSFVTSFLWFVLFYQIKFTKIETEEEDKNEFTT